MSEERDKIEERPGPGKRAEILGLRPAVTGAYVTLRCLSCRETLGGYLPTVAGIPVGRYQCPRCQDLYEVGPEEFEAALGRDLPPRSFSEMVEVTEEATLIAETWHQAGPMAELLTYRGLNLGEPTERFLLSFITLGLLGAEAPGEDDP